MRCIATKHGGKQSQRSCWNNRDSGPCEQERKWFAVSACEVVVVAAGVRVGTRQFRITQRADERDNAAGNPKQQEGSFTAYIGGHQRRSSKDSGAYNYANNHPHRIFRREGGNRVRELERSDGEAFYSHPNFLGVVWNFSC